MMLNEILPKIQNLTKNDKIRLLQFLATEIAKDEGITNLHSEDERQFWLETSHVSLEQIWGHPDEEVYNELL